MNEFEINDCVLLTKMSGMAPALNLREIRDRISSCGQNVLYHHFCETPLVPAFDYPEYRNDFAVWVKQKIDDSVLAERLGMIDPYSFYSFEDLRMLLLEIIDERLSETPYVPSAHVGHEFYFMEATTMVFDTGERIRHPDNLAEAISRMTNGSIYFHFLEARHRPPLGVDDFTAWLMSLAGDWEHYIQAFNAIDFPFYTLNEIRRELKLSLLKKGGNE
jgi:hypothetical protein